MKTKYIFAFYSSFLKKNFVNLNEDHVNFKYSFQKKMLSNLICVLIYSFTESVINDGFKDSFSENFVYNIGRKMSTTEFTVNEATICRVAIF